ncbi:MAG: hypothetical protein IT342_24445 [Candidatus Melainabacteria bacterium]|nr:hypothetical protein [Candidatus Melainabacteria bacterium]
MHFRSTSITTKLASANARNSTGAQAAEFAAALTILVMFFVIPLLDFGVIPIRWGLANHLITSYSVNFARAETLSRAFEQLEEDTNLQDLLKKIGGVNAKRLRLALVITKPSAAEKKLVVEEPKRIPTLWLPDSPNGPFQYELELLATVEISPLLLISLGEKKIPGLNAPFTVTIISSSHWENLGRNPNTNEFFMNE